MGSGPCGLPALRVRARRTDGSRVSSRDPRRSAFQPAPAGDRARAGRSVRENRRLVRRGQPYSWTAPESHPVVQGGRRSGPRPRCGGRRPGRLRREPAEVRHPRFGHRVHGRGAGRSARGLARALPKQGARGSYRQDRNDGCLRRRPGAPVGHLDRATRHAQSATLPRPDGSVPRGAGAVR